MTNKNKNNKKKMMMTMVVVLAVVVQKQTWKILSMWTWGKIQQKRSNQPDGSKMSEKQQQQTKKKKKILDNETWKKRWYNIYSVTNMRTPTKQLNNTDIISLVLTVSIKFLPNWPPIYQRTLHQMNINNSLRQVNDIPLTPCPS